LQIIIPNAAAHIIQDDPLKAVIIAHGPMTVGRARKLRHDIFCQRHISRCQIGAAWRVRRCRQIQFHITQIVC